MSPAATVPDCLKIRLNKSYKLSPRGCEAPATWYRCQPPTPTDRGRKPASVESPQARKPASVGEGKRSVYKGAEGAGDIQAQISPQKPKFAQVNFTNGLHITPVQVQ